MDIVVIGAGGHCSVVLDILESMIDSGDNIFIKGLLDDNPNLYEFRGYKVLDKIENALFYEDNNTAFIIAIGNNNIRKSIAMKFNKLKYFTAIHPSAIISKNAQINKGTVIMPNVVVNAGAKVGSHVILNTCSIIEHDNIIGNYTHISPGVTLCGGVSIGKGCHIGANSTIIQYKSVGENTIIGAGSTVIKDIECNVTAVGSPARVIK